MKNIIKRRIFKKLLKTRPKKTKKVKVEVKARVKVGKIVAILILTKIIRFKSVQILYKKNKNQVKNYS